MLILSDEMDSLSNMAALKGYNSNDGKKAIISGKINIGLGGRKLGQEAIQLHGGMGVTEEMEIGQYFKRLTMLDTFLGNSDFYLNEFNNIRYWEKKYGKQRKWILNEFTQQKLGPFSVARNLKFGFFE